MYINDIKMLVKNEKVRKEQGNYLKQNPVAKI